jgi:2-amino-4-hydroxy-6-hydroxymethyldihydropteridine diphosphokinase
MVGLGSNLEGRMDFLRAGLEKLAEGGLQVSRVSSVYETPPIGHLEQPPFLNLALSGETTLDPRGLLSLLQRVEEECGRERSFPNAPRTLDCDLVFYGDRIVRNAGLHVPHGRWKERSFVVYPLEEIAPDFRDPETGWRIVEVARVWPTQPEEIHMVETPEGLLAAWDKGA